MTPGTPGSPARVPLPSRSFQTLPKMEADNSSRSSRGSRNNRVRQGRFRDEVLEKRRKIDQDRDRKRANPQRRVADMDKVSFCWRKTSLRGGPAFRLRLGVKSFSPT